ncbi:hypothetical protein [Leptolyngbya sp. FACHB-261]|nr:hypothetical protein [Leptolyngbya sp. FACHB-261]
MRSTPRRLRDRRGFMKIAVADKVAQGIDTPWALPPHTVAISTTVRPR